MPATPSPHILSEDQVNFFGREGYLVVEDLFTDADLQAVIDEITGVIDERSRELVAAGKLSRTYDELDFEHRLTRITAETPAVYEAILAGRLCGPGIFNLIRHPRLLDVAQQFLGPEIVGSSVYRLRPKMPGHAWGPVPWHQDSGYFEPYCDTSLIITVWIPLVDATPERGCLYVLPRVHAGPVLRHRSDKINVYLEIPEQELPEEFQEIEPVCVPVKKGGVLLLTNRTPHASFNNDTDVIRWSMDFRYQSTKLPTNAAITRLPGEAIGGAGDEVPAACYPPEADFLVRSRTRPKEVLKDAEAFKRLRQTHRHSPVTDRWAAKFFDS